MKESFTCIGCGAPLDKGVSSGTCTRCLLKAALADRENEVREEALKLLTPEDRVAFVQGACADDPVLVQRILDWLKHSDTDLAVTFKPRVTLHHPEPLDRIGRYKLLQKIGEGGWGIVYMADQMEPVRRRVALKVIKVGMDTKQVVARFEVERQALAMMDHPNIAKVLDAGATDSGRPYFVMELVKGVTITKYCDDNQLTTKERLEIFISVCQAIQHAHQKGIIHRDIKPSNIMITLHDGMPVPKVIDFGIAKATQQELTEKTVFTQYNQFIGTPSYMSPEQAEMSGLDIDTRSDIYSLGVVLYELLVGRTPLDPRELMSGGYDEIRRRIKEQEPPKPSTKMSTLSGEERTTIAKHRKIDPAQLGTELRGDLDWIVLKALEKDRTRRYETANGLAMDLKRHLANEPVLAVAPSARYRLKKYVKRHRAALAVAAGIAGLLIVGTAVSTWQAVRATGAQRSAERATVAEKEQRLVAQTERDRAKTAQGQAEHAEKAEKQARLQADAEKAEARRLLYVADMNLAQQAWEQNNLGRLRQMLEETEAFPDRGFEWLYWERLAHLDLKTFRGHLESISSVAFSPDGNRIATGGLDSVARVWEVNSGRVLLELNEDHTRIYALTFSPDGRRIATCRRDHTARIWDATDGQELLTLKGHRAPVRCLAFSLDGQRIVTGSDDEVAKVWDVVSGKEILALKGHTASIRSVAYSPDNRRIVTGSDDLTAKVWDAVTGQVLLTLKGHQGHIVGVVLSPDGRLIATGAKDQTVKIWESATGRELRTIRGHSKGVEAVAFSPDGNRILTGSDDQTAKVWDTTSGEEVLTLKGHSGAVSSVAFSPDGQRILTGSYDQTAKLWPADATSVREMSILYGHTKAVNSVAFSPDGRRTVTTSDDGTAKVWDWPSGRELLTLRGHLAEIWSVAISKDGQRIVTGSHDQTAKVWDPNSGQELFSLRGHSSGIDGVALSPDGRWIVTASSDHLAKLWELASGRESWTLKGHTDRVKSAAFSPDSQRVVTASEDGTAKVWEVATGRELLALRGHSKDINAVAFSPDGLRIATCSRDETAKVWDAGSGRELLTLKGHTAAINSLVFSSDGRRILTGSEDRLAKVWESTTGRELLTLRGSTATINSIAFSPDEQWIVTACNDNSIGFWQAARPEQASRWAEEERSGQQLLAALARERTTSRESQRMTRSMNVGTLKHWLILAPIAWPAGRTGADELDREQIPGEAWLRPKAGETSTVRDGKLKWEEVALEDYIIDFNAILGHATAQSVAYAVCYVRSEADQAGLRMLVGSDDEAKIYLNGQQVHRIPVPRTFIVDQDVVPGITLKAGLNLMVFKVLNERVDWKGSIRFTDLQGNPVSGIEVTLTPP